MDELSEAEFSSDQTHGFIELESFTVSKTSAGLGWTSAYVSVQSELPYAAGFKARPDILIVSVDAGSVLASLKTRDCNESVLRPSGSVAVIPDRMSFEVDLRSPIDTTHLYLRRSTLEEVAGGLYRGDPANVNLIVRMAIFDPILDQLSQAVRAALDEDPAISGLYVEHMMRAIAAHLIRKHTDAGKSGTPSSINSKLSFRQLARIRELIEDRLSGRLTLADLSTEIGISADHFGRLFKQATGMPVHQFVLRCRVDRARRLLTDTAMPIAAIAFECGFSDQVHLTRLFRRFVGTTPAAFRQNISSSHVCSSFP